MLSLCIMRIKSVIAAGFVGLCFVCSASAQSKSFTLGKWIEVHNAILKELNRSYVDSLEVGRIEREAVDAMLDALGEDSIAARIGVQDMIALTEQGAEQLRETAAEGRLTDIPVRIGDNMRELTDRYHMLTDWDGIEDGRLFALEGGCFRGVYLVTDQLTANWDNSVVQGIRMEQGCLWGLCPGETQRSAWLDTLGEPDGSAEVREEKAEANRLTPGNCDYYRCGEYLLQLYSDADGMLVCVMLTE